MCVLGNAGFSGGKSTRSNHALILYKAVVKHLRATLFITILIFLLIGCGQTNNEKKIAIEKPIQHFLSFRLVDNEFVEYYLDSLANFNNVLKIIEEIDCRKKYVLFNLETKDKIYKIQPLQVCNDIFDYKFREIIYVNTDSITVNHEIKYPIDSLKMVLRNHLINPNADNNYPSANEKQLISINVDSTKNIADTKNLLLNIMTNINELDAKKYANFIFEENGIIQVVEE